MCSKFAGISASYPQSSDPNYGESLKIMSLHILLKLCQISHYVKEICVKIELLLSIKKVKVYVNIDFGHPCMCED